VQAMTTISAGRIEPLIARARRFLDHTRTDAMTSRFEVPDLPDAWIPITEGDVSTAHEVFRAYVTHGGLIATLESGAGVPAGRLVAMVSLGGHRLSVTDPGDGRLLARWTCAGVGYQIGVCHASLAVFMELVLGLRWPGRHPEA
jgi:hypothetical protein